MAFPVVQGSNGAVVNGGALGTTAVNVPYPTGIQAGEMLLLIVRMDLGEKLTARAGFELMWSSLPTGTVGTTIILKKTATGSESGSAALTADQNTGHQSSMLRISGEDLDIGFQMGPQGIGNSANPNSPAYTPPSGAEDTLWLSIALWGGFNANVSSGPAGYTAVRTDRQGTLSVGPGGVSTYRLDSNTATEDPGQWTLSASGNWRSLVLAVRPAGGAAIDYPVMRGFEYSVYASTTNVATRPVNIPDGCEVGDLLLLFGSRHASTGPGIVVPDGWTSLGNQSRGAMRGAVAYKVYDGSEGSSVSVSYNPTVNGAALLLVRVKNGKAPEIGSIATGLSTSPDPGTLIPSFDSDIALWLCFIAYEHYQTIASVPASYTELAQVRASTHVSFGNGLVVGYKHASISSDTPGAGSLNQAKDWVAALTSGEEAPPARDMTMVV